MSNVPVDNHLRNNMSETIDLWWTWTWCFETRDVYEQTIARSESARAKYNINLEDVHQQLCYLSIILLVRLLYEKDQLWLTAWAR